MRFPSGWVVYPRTGLSPASCVSAAEASYCLTSWRLTQTICVLAVAPFAAQVKSIASDGVGMWTRPTPALEHFTGARPRIAGVWVPVCSRRRAPPRRGLWLWNACVGTAASGTAAPYSCRHSWPLQSPSATACRIRWRQLASRSPGATARCYASRSTPRQPLRCPRPVAFPAVSAPPRSRERARVCRIRWCNSKALLTGDVP
jgi:hypothetical protein